MFFKGAHGYGHGSTVLKVQPKFFVCNLCQSSRSLTILVPLWFVIISGILSIFVKHYFQVSFNLKVILSMVKVTQNNMTQPFYVLCSLRLLQT